MHLSSLIRLPQQTRDLDVAQGLGRGGHTSSGPDTGPVGICPREGEPAWTGRATGNRRAPFPLAYMQRVDLPLILFNVLKWSEDCFNILGSSRPNSLNNLSFPLLPGRLTSASFRLLRSSYVDCFLASPFSLRLGQVWTRPWASSVCLLRVCGARPTSRRNHPHSIGFVHT